MTKTTLTVLFAFLLLSTGIVFMPNTRAATEADIEQAIKDGLVWLVAQQNTNPSPDYGSWNAYWGQLETGTGLALYKLCDRAYELKKQNPDIESPFDPDYEYYQNVINGFDWVFNHLVVVDIGIQDHTTGATGTFDDPDTNGNGKGVTTQNWYSSYTTGILLAAIAASGTPDRLVNDPSSPVNGWTYKQVAQDMADFLAFSQVDPSVDWGGYTVEGGWDYTPVNNGVGGTGWQGDQSNSGYAVLGLGEAQAFGCTIPDWVKTELNWWIDWVQDDVNADANDGGSWYSFPDEGIGVNILKTGNLIFEMALVGDTPTTPRVTYATDYLVRHWSDASGWDLPPGWDGTPAEYQTMFCTMKGLEYMGIDTFDTIDWFADFSDAIVAQQDKTPGPTYGSWQHSSGRGDPVIITEWALLTLEKVAPPTPVITVYVDIKPGSWPNPINVGSKGVFAVAICGTEDFDAMTIDPTTVEIYIEGIEEGISPVRWCYSDVATPYTGEPGGGHTLTGDGYLDLLFHFDTQAVVNGLGLSAHLGETIPLIIRGKLYEDLGGTPIQGQDYVWILKQQKFLKGDITGSVLGVPDGKVDVKDVVLIASLYGAVYPDGKYNPDFDLNNDLRIDSRDCVVVCRQYGQTVQ
jgi:hypothetical protein